MLMSEYWVKQGISSENKMKICPKCETITFGNSISICSDCGETFWLSRNEKRRRMDLEILIAKSSS